jgi:hypothetical protein
MKYDVEYFINKFEAIPSNLWCGDTFTLGERRCALGHCGYRTQNTVTGPDTTIETAEGMALDALFLKNGMDVTTVNDSGILYGINPKDQILRVLYSIRDGKR